MMPSMKKTGSARRLLGLCILAASMTAWLGCAGPPREKDSDARLNEVTVRAENARARGDAPSALRGFEEALRIAVINDDRPAIAHNLNDTGGMHFTQGQYEEALSYYEEAERAYSRLKVKDLKGLATCRGNMGCVYAAQKQWKKALECQEAALALDREANNPFGASNRLNNMGFVYRMTGDLAKAEKCLAEAQEMNLKCDNKAGLAANLCNLGSVCEDRGQTAEALKLYEQAADLDESAENSAGQAVDLHNAGRMAEKLGDLSKARDCYERALYIVQALNTYSQDIQDDRDRVAKKLDKQGK